MERTCSSSQARASICSQGAAIATVTTISNPTSICAARVPLIRVNSRSNTKATMRISMMEMTETGMNPKR